MTENSQTATIPLSAYDNRELSWLKFNERVLEESADENLPLMERLLFESIFLSNLDEFFMVRVGSLVDAMLDDDNHKDGKTALRPSEQLDKICRRVHELVKIKDESMEAVERLLAKNGVERLNINNLDENQTQYVEDFFVNEIKPFLNAYVIDKSHPFPFLDGKKIYAALKLSAENSSVLGIVGCSGNFPRVVFLPTENNKIRYILAEDIILSYADCCFYSFKTEEKVLVRITRSADINVDADLDDELDFRESMSKLVSRRKRLCPVRLQLSGEISALLRSMLLNRMELDESQVFIEKSPLDLSYVSEIMDRTADRAELYYDKLSPQQSKYVKPEIPMCEQIKNHDILLCLPYESIEPFLRMLKEAAEDKSVESIKMTLYRVAKNSRVIKSLCTAAENGKKVTVCVELRARFDEENNIEWSKVLEESGCRVIYGPFGQKVHSKLCLITRRIGGDTEKITQIGTGNYNEKTAELYTDFSLMTANEAVAENTERVFERLIDGKTVENSDILLVSPNCLQSRVIEMLDDEISLARMGGDAYFGAKMNGLTDKKIIDKLIEASQAGVKIDLVVRGISCLVGSIDGVTDNIRIISIVGRFLEHARIYIFGKGARAKIYISSADFMTRNTCRRVEAAVPLLDEEVKKRVWNYFQTELNDNVKAREQHADGKYSHVKNDNPPLDSQIYFYNKAYENVSTAVADSLTADIKPQAKKDESTAEKTQLITDNDEKTQIQTPQPMKKKGLFARIISFFKRSKKY